MDDFRLYANFTQEFSATPSGDNIPDDRGVEDEVTVGASGYDALISFNEGDDIRVLSSLALGAKALYPEDWADVVWIVWRSLGGDMEFCERVAKCIDESEVVKDALSRQLGENGLGAAADGADSLVGSKSVRFSDDNLLDPSKCLPDEVAGACVAVVEQMDLIARDWIEGMVAFALPAEFAGYIAQSIPVAGDLAVPEFGDLIDWVTDEVLTQYNGAYDTALRNEAACLLYSRCCASCELTLDDVLAVFSAESGINLNPFTAWRAFLADIVTLSLGDGIVYGVWQLIAGTWKIGSLFTGISGLQALAYAAQSAAPIDPATLGCDPCQQTWSQTFDFTASASGWASVNDGTNNPRSEYVAGLGWHLSPQNSDPDNFQIYIGLPSQTNVTGFGMTLNEPIPNANRQFGLQGVSQVNATESVSFWQSSTVTFDERTTSETDVYGAFVGGTGTGSFRALFRIATGGGSGSPTTYCTSITIEGTGVNPFL